MAKKGFEVGTGIWAAGRSWNACCGLAPAFYGRLPAAFEIQPDRFGEAAEAGFTFLQISDSHVGFDKKANPQCVARYRKPSPRLRLCPTSRHSCSIR